MVKKSKSYMNSFLNYTEKVGNMLPHPATLFAIFAGGTLVLSLIAALLNWNAVHPGTGETIVAVNLLSVAGLHKIILETVTNFTGFAPLGVVLVAMLGIGIAESSGLIGALVRLLVLNTPAKFLTFTLVLCGVLSNMASDVGYVLLIPLAGIIFIAVGRHPIIGMAAAFAGVSGGFSANLFVGTIDVLLAGISTEAAQILDPSYYVNPLANYYFMLASTVLITVLGTYITEKIVAPRFPEYKGDVTADDMHALSERERRGLRWAFTSIIILAALVLLGLIPENGCLRGPDGGIMNSPFIKGIVTFIFILSIIPGLAYGIGAGKIKSDADVIHGMSNNMKAMSTYIVLVFFAAQFLAYFKWSHLGEIFAIHGADFLKSMNVGTVFLIISFALLSAVINLAMGSASAKWALMAPIFIPMFMQLGYSPELTQAIYRVGDSTTNLISPMMSYFALIIAFFQKYDEKASIGTIISTMLPYSILFFIGWIILLLIWVIFGLPLGPGVSLYM